MSNLKFSFNELRGEYVGKLAEVNAYISGESMQKALFARFKATCMRHRCKAEVIVDLSVDPKLLYNTMTRTQKKVEVKTEVRCPDPDGHSWRLEQQDPPMVYQEVYLRDSMEQESLSGACVNQNYHGYILGRAPESKDATLQGILFVNERTDDLEFLINACKPAQASLDTFELTPEEFASMKGYFTNRSSLQGFMDLAKHNNPRIAGRDEAKLASLLAYVSPTWIKVNDQLKAGTLRVMLFGDPRTGKGSIENYLHEKLRVGKHAIGETSSRTGITYTIDNERGIIVWGVMVEADRQLVVIEALHKFPAEDLATMRETLVKLYVEVRRSFTAKAMARTRILADSNSRQEMKLYPFPCMAVRDLPCFLDGVDITRWDLFVPFKGGEVTPDEITDAIMQGKDDGEFLERVKALILWVWSRRPEQVSFSERALQAAKTAYNELLKEYTLPDIPLIHEDSFFSLLRIGAAFAALDFNTDDGIKLKVEPSHISLARSFIVQLQQLLEVPEYLSYAGTRTLTEDAYAEFRGLIASSDVAESLIECLVKGPRNSTDLAAETGHDAVSIRRIAGQLKVQEIISKRAQGYALSGQGIQAWKRLKEEKAHATDATNATPAGQGVLSK